MSKNTDDDEKLVEVYVNILGGIMVKKDGECMVLWPYEAIELKHKLELALSDLKDNL